MVCLRWRPYLLAAVAAAATERVSGPALGVVLYSGNGSSAAVKVAAALTVQYFPPHAEVRHYLCTDARSAAAVHDSLGNGTVLTTFPEVDQDAKFLHCVQRVREPAVLLVMDDWWLIAPVDADVLVAAAQLVGSPSGPRISSVRPVCWDREQLAFGGVPTPWPGVFIQFDLPLQPTIWRRDVLAELLKRTIAWVPAHSRHCAQRRTCPREKTRARQGRQRVEGFSRAAYSWRQLWRQGVHDTAYPDDSSASLVYSGAPHCPAQRRSPQNFAGYDWIHALQHGQYLLAKRVGAHFCAMSRTARVHLRSLLVELDYASRHHYFASESACDAADSTPMPPGPPAPPPPPRETCCSSSNVDPDNCEPPPWAEPTRRLAWSLELDAKALRGDVATAINPDALCCWNAKPAGHMYTWWQNATWRTNVTGVCTWLGK